jgi:FAD/FMN-containing dehydrogenase
MQRRELLLSAAALPLLASPLSAAAPAAGAPFTRVHPTDPGWPSAAQWQALSDSVGGALLAVQPLFEPCAVQRDAPACRELTAQLSNPFFIGDQPGGTQVSGWLDAWTPAASAYALRARKGADVQQAINFARTHRLRLAVKGGGHSYQGTSCAADSLLIWTRDLKQLEMHEAFVPQGCAGRVKPVSAVSAGSGAMWIDLYDAVTTRGNRYVQGGGCTSVGVAGLIQSGGFGSFSKGFGMAAAGLLEAEVVTADGRLRTVNACRDPDLFWALKGGGGGSFAVVTRLTLETHPLPEFMGAAWGSIRAHSPQALRALLAQFFDFYVRSLFNPHWGEQVHVSPDNALKISMVCQGLDKAEVRALWQPFFGWVTERTADFTITDALGTGAKPARLWWSLEGNRSMKVDPRAGVPAHHGWWNGDQDQVGAYLHGYDSLWLPAALLQSPARGRFIDALLAASRHKEVELHFNKGLAGAPREALAAAADTATHPAVREAFALALIADGEGANYPGMARAPLDVAAGRQDARAIDAATAELARLVPRAGSYVSESNYFNERWRDAFWGPHYARLKRIKAKYDPDGLFIVHHGVGSEDWSADGFRRLA